MRLILGLRVKTEVDRGEDDSGSDLQLLLHLDLCEGSQESTPAPHSHHLEADPTNCSENICLNVLQDG